VIPSIRLRAIPLSQISLPEIISDPGLEDLGRLEASLQEVGLLNPPWLRPEAGGPGFQVVTGVRRLKAAARLGWQEISAHVVPEDTPDLFCLLVHLFDNAFSRGFNLREQAALAVRLLEHGGRETVASGYLPYLGLPPSPAHLARLVKLAGLEEPWQRLAAQGRLALTAGARLAEWDPQDRAAAWSYFTGLRLSQSKQEEFLDQVDLLARREGLSPKDVLAREELHKVLDEGNHTPPEKTAAVRRLLYRWVYPRLSAAQADFETALARLGWKRPARFRLHPPAAFEGPDYRLEINFRDAPELKELLAEIARLARLEEFGDLTNR
jgi:ParB-like chromosome segregation protein Spo0J